MKTEMERAAECFGESLLCEEACMTETKGKPVHHKDLLKKAQKTAAQGNTQEALAAFASCIREYLRARMPFKALAAAKVARVSLKGHPRAQAMLIKLLVTMDLQGDASEEFLLASASWKKEEVSIFKGLSMREFTDLLEIMEVIRVKKGSYITIQGGKGEDIYVIISGTVEVLQDNRLINTLKPGAVFGELGFFSRGIRTATIRATEGSELVVIPPKGLRELCLRHEALRNAIDELYSERILKKAMEDLQGTHIRELNRHTLAGLRFPKGHIIPMSSTEDISIIKYGTVEINYDEKGLPVKRFLKPGNVIWNFKGTARASTEVEVIRAGVASTELPDDRE